MALQLNRAADCAETRLAYLDTLKIAEHWKAEEAKCRADILHWFKQWAWTLDPREDSPLPTIPFLPFPFQEEAIRWLDLTVFVKREDGAAEKSRDQGVTWIATAWSTYHWKYRDFFQVLFGSKNEDAVDSIKEPDTILEKVRFQIRLLPEQMLPAGFDQKRDMGWMKITNPENGSVISGEAPTQNFARSGRFSAIIFDEHAAWPFGGFPQWTAASASSKSKISVSTPQGKRTKQSQLAHKQGFNKLTLKWDLHPWKDERWYDGQTLSMDDQEIAQEIDIDYEASQPGLVYKDWTDGRDSHHVITHSQFEARFGTPYVPTHWLLSIYMDVGTSPEHPTATGFYTRPAESSPRFKGTGVDGVPFDISLSDSAFLYRSMTVYDEEIGDIWDSMKRVMKPLRELERVRVFKNSHEAESERLTLQRKHKAPVQGWKPGATRGIAQMRAALKIIDEDKPHPFKPWLTGRPLFYIIVPDDQIDEAVDEQGHQRFREEMKVYHFPKQVEGMAVQAQKPYALFNDHMDESRMAAADGFVPLLPMNDAERRERNLAPELRKDVIVHIPDPETREQAERSREIHLRRMEGIERVEQAKARRVVVPKVRFRRS